MYLHKNWRSTNLCIGCFFTLGNQDRRFLLMAKSQPQTIHQWDLKKLLIQNCCQHCKWSLPSWLFPRRQPRWRVGCLTSLQSVPQALLCPWLMACLDSFSTSWWSLPETVWTSPRKAWSPPGTLWSYRRSWRSCCMRWVFFFLFFFLSINVLHLTSQNTLLILFTQFMLSNLLVVDFSISDRPMEHCMLICSCIGNIARLTGSSSLTSNDIVILYYLIDLCTGQAFDYVMIHYVTFPPTILLQQTLPPAKKITYCLGCILRLKMTFLCLLRKLDNFTLSWVHW